MIIIYMWTNFCVSSEEDYIRKKKKINLNVCHNVLFDIVYPEHGLLSLLLLSPSRVNILESTIDLIILSLHPLIK